jgi:hypothetical protein
VSCLKYYAPNAKKPFHQEHQVVKQGQDGEDTDIEAKKNATLDQNIFKKDLEKVIKDNLKGSKNMTTRDNPNAYLTSSHSNIKRLPLYMAHTIDFGIFHEDAVMTFAEIAAQ